MSKPPTLPDDELAAYAAVDEALRREPLQAPPPGLARAVLARVRGSSRPPFRLSWMDLALGMFGGLMAAFTLLVWNVLRQGAAAQADPVAAAAAPAPELAVLGAVIVGGAVLAAVAVAVGVVAVVQARRAK